MRWLSGHARLARRALLWATALPLVAGVALVVQAWLLAAVIDRVVTHGAPLADEWRSVGTVAALWALRTGLNWAGERAGTRAAETIKYDIRTSLFARLAALGPGWTRARRSGELAGALVDQVDAIEGYFARYLPSMIAATVLPIAFSVVLMPADIVAALVLLVTAPLIPVFMALVGWGAEAASRRHQRAMSRLTGFFADRLRGAATLKLFGRAQAESQAVAAASHALRERTMTVLRIAFLSSAVLEFFAALGVAGVATYFGLSYLGFLDLRSTPLTLSIGMFCLFMAPEVYAPLRQFAANYHDRAAARAAVAQLDVMFEGLPTQDRAQHEGVRPAVNARGAAVLVEGLRVSHAPDATPVLCDVAWSVAPGEHVALMGASGAGKSTLLEVLARLRTDGDSVRLDDVALSKWDEGALRSRVAWIGQKPFLLAGSIADNIRVGVPDASDDQVRHAADMACVTDFARHLPDGLNTLLDARSRGVSGGQAQRIALARLYLRDPALILLDEPTAHLDAQTAARVIDNLLQFAEHRTLVLATHDAAIAARMQQTVTLAAGRIVACGAAAAECGKRHV
ncbi:thiol reductant ABC exporter subunit CydD [Schauerella aestuarii]|uniref:thiol reductant ABC exporter subunit CydD n=1 Tax=Schauerella aestuarii TaxID=2511204 RepID=UPI0013680B5C|nr:thiol reductant ABC exporter subunit CydD [Achromobacter aestuarii]MYZ43803.1 thiol reductant ABC exporter subunit CydD [Achromobacter aestuarii]